MGKSTTKSIDGREPGSFEVDEEEVVMIGFEAGDGMVVDDVNRNKHDGCYNTLCTGFVQVDRSLTPSARITPLSTIGGAQYVIKVNVYQDPSSGNWWLIIQKNGVFVGYWPKNLFTYLADGANSICWGGVAQIVNKNYGLDFLLNKIDITPYVEGKNCYDILYHKYVAERGASLTFGGPGGINCG
ncbi:uncharacterized protein LOC122665829 [Telopea speciosissima]|uniref:uncharacterized protein LOC122665829 n=1 Tax=Telopea speciosissima TaxID=54955 RepID=UPI001CC35809|nr:uncharacterized protein LOC122665829 [Telopea speciosissima]